MANRRMISSDLFEDEFYMDLDLFQQTLWIGLIVRCADDQGRLQDNPIIIKSQIYPAGDYSPEFVNNALDVFSQSKKIIRYESNGKRIIQIINWWKHQTPSWASPSKYPPPDGWIDREKYHTAGNKIASSNWDKKGGYQSLGSVLPSIQHSPIKEGDVNGEGNVKDEGEGEVSDEPRAASATDPFFLIQKAIESHGITLSGEADIKTVTEFVKDGVMPEDVLAGIQWKAANNGGKAIRYLSAIIGPARTAKAKRIQTAFLPPSKTRKLTGPNGEIVYEEIR